MQERRADLLQILGLLDLTSLDESDTPERIGQLCKRAATPYGSVAAVCVYPAFVATARQTLSALPDAQAVAVAAVANFPAGDSSPEAVAREVTAALADGADEVDLVFPWRAYLEGNEALPAALLSACRRACKGYKLKVILETGELSDDAAIRGAARMAIEYGADFLKTSTGKVPVNATPEAARTLLESILGSGRDVGCKVSGGIRSCSDALRYFDLAGEIMGHDWIGPEHFRFGASGLLDDLLDALGADKPGIDPEDNY